MPAIMMTENFGDFLDSRVRKIYSDEYKERMKPGIREMLFSVQTTTKNYEIMSGLGGGSDLQPFDGSISYDTLEQLYDVTTYFPEKAKGFKIERKLYDDDLSGMMNQRPKALARDVARTQEKICAELWNGAFVGTGGGDSKPLCSSSHPYSPTVATTMSNAGSTSFSAVAVEATRQFGHTSIFNNRGELFEVNYDMILCTVANEEKAYEIISSAGKVDTPNNNRNFHEGKYKLLTWDRLTDANNWFN